MHVIVAGLRRSRPWQHAERMPSVPDRWNHNIHYHPLILQAIGSRRGRVLDVGCGEGFLAGELRADRKSVV